MAFGVTSEGFKAKRLADIKTELETSFQNVFGNNINLDARGPFGQIIGIMAENLETNGSSRSKFTTLSFHKRLTESVWIMLWILWV